MLLTLGANWLVSVMATLFVLTCIFMMLVILIQKPKGGGLSGAFGGAGGSSQAAFGAKTGDLLTMITIGCFVAFLGLAIGLVYAIRADVTPKPPPQIVAPISAPASTPLTPVTDDATGMDASQTPAEVDDSTAFEEIGTTTEQTAPAEDTEPDTQP